MPDFTLTIGAVFVSVTDTLVRWTSGLRVDADGAPNAYHPISARGRDNLDNAGKPGKWFGIIVGPDGQPVVQGPGDPCPGYYVSPTSLADKRLPATNPMRYVDAGKVPYVAIPRELIGIVRLGDLAHVRYREHWSPAIVADVGPRGRIGEGSCALAAALGIDPSARHGGCGAGVEWTVYRGTATSPPWPRTADDMLAQVMRLSGQAVTC